MHVGEASFGGSGVRRSQRDACVATTSHALSPTSTITAATSSSNAMDSEVIVKIVSGEEERDGLQEVPEGEEVAEVDPVDPLNMTLCGTYWSALTDKEQEFNDFVAWALLLTQPKPSSFTDPQLLEDAPNADQERWNCLAPWTLQYCRI